MKRNLLIILATLLLSCSLVGCESETVVVNVENKEELYSDRLDSFISIDSSFVYDSATRIVYRKNYTYSINYVYIPYYAPNGLPYRYNPETNTFEEIESEAIK